MTLLLRDSSFLKELQPVSEPITFVSGPDGRYTANIANTTVAGVYTVVFQIDGKRADIGTYTRTETQSTALRFGHPRRDPSALTARALGTTRFGRQYALRVKPVDQYGNYLGPDYGDALKVLLNGKIVKESPRDELDGSYIITLNTPATGDPRVTVLVLDEALFDGPLSRISAGAGRK
jgi:hypothetical protein